MAMPALPRALLAAAVLAAPVLATHYRAGHIFYDVVRNPTNYAVTYTIQVSSAARRARESAKKRRSEEQSSDVAAETRASRATTQRRVRPASLARCLCPALPLLLLFPALCSSVPRASAFLLPRSSLSAASVVLFFSLCVMGRVVRRR
jgi:hypothetical protein